MFAVITGVICVALITVEDRSRKIAWWNWPIGILTSAAYVKIFWDYRLYFNSVLQLFYVLTGFYGMWAWKRGGQNRTELLVYRLKSRTVALFSAGVVAAAWVLSLSYDALGVNAAAPFWDALVVTMSVTAQFVMTRKYRDHWWWWMAVDVVGVVLFASQDLYATALLYFIYGCLVVRGIFTWERALKHNTTVTAVAP